jgi:galactitol-specific phosphotransferase system IIB component
MEKDSKSYDDIILSKDVLKGMSLNPYDQIFLKRVLDRQDEVIDEVLAETYKLQSALILTEVKRLLDDQKKEIFSELEKINLRMDSIEASIKGITIVVDVTKGEVDQLKRVNAWYFIILRGLVWLSIGLGLIRMIHGPFIK